jgi:hypothetical protein
MPEPNSISDAIEQAAKVGVESVAVDGVRRGLR